MYINIFIPSFIAISFSFVFDVALFLILSLEVKSAKFFNPLPCVDFVIINLIPHQHLFFHLILVLLFVIYQKSGNV